MQGICEVYRESSIGTYFAEEGEAERVNRMSVSLLVVEDYPARALNGFQALLRHSLSEKVVSSGMREKECSSI